MRPDIVAVRKWLIAKLKSHEILRAYLFGSLLSNNISINDVDVLMVFKDWDVRSTLYDIKKSFREEFALPLHIQIFHESQVGLIDEFLKRAIQTEKL